MAADERRAKRGDAAPLEGVVGREIMSVLNLAFMAIGVSMLSGMAMKLGAKLGGPTLAGGKAGAAAPPSVPGAKGPMVSNISVPRPRDMPEN